ncbi:MAG: anti-sigma factor antagonist [Acidobacteria bacterium]|nr:MAG: anti-sigma factor antagonist [Acidobacteriota bacterium]
MLTITERTIDDVTILDLDGSIRLGDEESRLRETIKGLLDAGRNKILLNMEKVDYIDSSGIGALVYSFTTVRRHGGQLKLMKLSDRVQDVLTLTKLLSVFDIFNNEEEAVRSFM